MKANRASRRLNAGKKNEINTLNNVHIEVRGSNEKRKVMGMKDMEEKDFMNLR